MDLCMECEDEELDPWQQMSAEPANIPQQPQPPPLTPSTQQVTISPQQNVQVLPQPPPLTPSPAVQQRVTSTIFQQPAQAQPVAVKVSQNAVGQVSKPTVKIVTQNSSTSQTTKPILINLTGQGTSQPTYLMPATQPGGQSYYLMPMNITGMPTLQTVSTASPVIMQQVPVPSVVQHSAPPNVTVMPQIIQVAQPAPAPVQSPPATKIIHVIENTATTTQASTQLKSLADQAQNNTVKPLYKLVSSVANNQAPSKTVQVTRPVIVRNTSTLSQAKPQPQSVSTVVTRAQVSQAKPAVPAQPEVHPVKVTQAPPKPAVATTSKVVQVTQASTKPAAATPSQAPAAKTSPPPQKTVVPITANKNPQTTTSATTSNSTASTLSNVPSKKKGRLPPPRVVAKILEDKTVVYVKCTESGSSSSNTTTQTRASYNSTPVTIAPKVTVTPTPTQPRPVSVHQAMQSPSPMAIVNTSTKASSLTYTCPLCNNKFFSLSSLTAHRQNCKKTATPAVTQSSNHPTAVVTVSSVVSSVIESMLNAPSQTSTSAPNKTPSPPNKAPSPASKAPEPKTIQLSVSIDEYYYGKKEPDPNFVEEKGSCVFKCYTCSKVLKSNIKYMNHIRHHIEHERQQNPDISDVTSCQRCFKRFETPFQLQCHLETMHNTSNPDMYCKICEISFKSEKILQNHLLNEHSPCEMPYACKLCGFRSSVLSDVESHFRSTHEGTKNLLCTFCLKIIVQCRAFDVHCLKHFRKSDKKKCKSCRLQFHSTSELQQHRKHDHVSFAPASVVQQHSTSKLVLKFPKKGSKGQDASLFAQSGTSGTTEYGLAGLPRGLKRNLNLSYKVLQDNATHTCLECGAKIQDLSSHYVKYCSCSKCRYSTCCSRAYADHMICQHQAQGRQRVISANMFQVHMSTCETGTNLTCGCGYTTSSGRDMAEHLQTCSYKSCYLESSLLKINVNSLTGFFRNKRNAGGTPAAKRARTDMPGGSGVEIVDLTEEDEDYDMVPGSFVCPHCNLHFNLRMPLIQHIKFCGPQEDKAEEEDTYTVPIKQEPEDPVVVLEDDREDMDTMQDDDNLRFTTLEDSSTAEKEDSEEENEEEERDEQKEWEASIGLDSQNLSSNTVKEWLTTEDSSTEEGTSDDTHAEIVVKVEKEESENTMDLQMPQEPSTAEDSGTAADDTSNIASTEVTIKVEKDDGFGEIENNAEQTVSRDLAPEGLDVEEASSFDELAEQNSNTQPFLDTSDGVPGEGEETMEVGDVDKDVAEEVDSQSKDPAEVETEGAIDNTLVENSTLPVIESVTTLGVQNASVENQEERQSTKDSEIGLEIPLSAIKQEAEDTTETTEGSSEQENATFEPDIFFNTVDFPGSGPDLNIKVEVNDSDVNKNEKSPKDNEEGNKHSEDSVQNSVDLS